MSHLLKTIVACGLLFLFAALAGMLPTRAGAPTPLLPADEDTLIYVAPAEITIAPSSTLDVTVEIDTIPATRAAQFSLSFDPDVLECISVSQGPFYSDWAAANSGSTFVFPVPACDNTLGKVTMMGVTVLTSVVGGPSGTGVIANLEFTAVGEGSTEIALADVIVADDSLESQALPTTIVNALVTVGNMNLYLPMIGK